MAQHGALAAPRGATGVENGCQVLGAAWHHLMLIAVVGGPIEQRAGAVRPQGVDMAHTVVESQLGHPAKAAGVADHHGRLGIGDEVLHFCGLVSGIERQKHMTTAQRGQVQHHGFDRLFHLHCNAAALWQIQRGQQIGDARTTLLQIGPGVVEAGAIGLNGLYGIFCQILRERCAQCAVNIGLRHIGHRDAVERSNSREWRCKKQCRPS